MYRRAHYMKVVEAAKAALSGADVERKAAVCGFRAAGLAHAGHESVCAAYEVPFMGMTNYLLYPSLELEREGGGAASRVLQCVVLHHLHHAREAALEGRYVSFAEIPGLAPYVPAVKRRVFDVLARAYGGAPVRLGEALAAVGGRAHGAGDASGVVWLLPRVPAMVVIYGADEEERAAASMLFDASVTEFLPLEDIVAAAELAAHRLRYFAVKTGEGHG
ncbi:MAG: DUF3786 domain-containing protein [bacterium]